MTKSSPKSEARRIALLHLYQMASEKNYVFSPGHFRKSFDHFAWDQAVFDKASELIELVLNKRVEVDKMIERHSAHWSIDRMSVIDRTLLRMAVSEMFYHDTPFKVAINEAIELCKEYSQEKSFSFVNGVLNAVAKEKESS